VTVLPAALNAAVFTTSNIPENEIAGLAINGNFRLR